MVRKCCKPPNLLEKEHLSQLEVTSGDTAARKPASRAMALRQEELRNHFGFCLKRKGATTAGLNQGKCSVQDSLNFGEELSRPRTEAEASLKAPAEGLGGSCHQLALRHLSASCPALCLVCS